MATALLYRGKAIEHMVWKLPALLDGLGSRPEVTSVFLDSISLRNVIAKVGFVAIRLGLESEVFQSFVGHLRARSEKAIGTTDWTLPRIPLA